MPLVNAHSIAQLKRCAAAPDAARHALYLTAPTEPLPTSLPQAERWRAVRKRRRIKTKELVKTPLALDFPDGRRGVLAVWDKDAPRFERLTGLRHAAMLLLEEHPTTVALVNLTADAQATQDAVYVLSVNGASLPMQKKKPPPALQHIEVVGEALADPSDDFTQALATARANLLARSLTVLPANVLTPLDYRQRIADLAKKHNWQHEEYDYARLRKLGAGAFCAVAQGAAHTDRTGDKQRAEVGGGAAIVHLSCGRRQAQRRVALVGKGICFDSGGLNLKPAKYMQGMHEDMAGSAVAVALMQAAAELDLPLDIDCWLAIAHNAASPSAYRQNDIITALNGETIEIVHTDAEGRLVLADTLTLATLDTKFRPQLLIDFATLTGSMIGALGNRYSGVFSNEAHLAALAVTAGKQSGERVCLFPHDPDYDEGPCGEGSGLESKVADVKQCSMAGEADHILAARFLARFVEKTPWLHVDLSAASCPGGLGALASTTTGFGVAWGLTLLQSWLKAEAAGA